MKALSELFDVITLAVPCVTSPSRSGETVLTGNSLSIAPLTMPYGHDLLRKILFPLWLMRNLSVLISQIRKADCVHTPVPGDIGNIGMLLAYILQKPLFVRYCGNWFWKKTAAEHMLRWFLERLAGGRNIVFATGGDKGPPSQTNPDIRWIFSTSLTGQEIRDCSIAKRQISPEEPRLIIVCAQERWKGTEALIRSIPIIMRDVSGVSLDVVGEGRLLPELKELAGSLGIEKKVRFHGRVGHDGVIRLLKESDIFCLPTRSEGFPKAVLEALACGLPVITTPVSVLPQLVGMDCGILLEEAVPAAIAKAAKEILSDAERYQAMSEKARQAASEYSLERWRDNIGAVLEQRWGRLHS